MNVRPFLDPPISAESFADCVAAVAAAQDRRVAGERPRSERFGFGAMPAERRAEIAAKGSEAARRKGGQTPPCASSPNAKDRFGLTWDEFWDYGALRGRGLDPEQAASVILGRRPQAGEG